MLPLNWLLLIDTPTVFMYNEYIDDVKETDTLNVHYHFDKRPEDEGLTFGNIVIHQVGDLFCKYNTVVGEHTQSCVELTCVISGKGLTRINGVEHALLPGEINIVFPKDKHEIISDSVDPLRYYFLGFSMLEDHPLYRAFEQFWQKQSQNERGWRKQSNIR